MRKKSEKYFKDSFSIEPWKEESSNIPYSVMASQRSQKKKMSLLDSENKLKRVSSLAGRQGQPVSTRKNNYSKYLSGEYLAKTIKEIGFLEKRTSKGSIETKKKKK